jgi:type 1 glutamine amidotransferase
VVDTLLFVDQVAPYSPTAPYHRGYGLAGVHGVLSQAWSAARQIADVVGLRAVHVEDVRDLEVDALESCRAVVLFTIGETPWSIVQRDRLTSRLREGRTAVIFLHSALDACLEWDDYGRVAGARFDGHPWTQEFVAAVDVDHPSTAHLGTTWRCVDEVYTFRGLRPDARVLLRIPDEQLDVAGAGVTVPSFGFPLSWCHDEGAGRVFTTALGHFPGCWESNDFLAHVAGGIGWAARLDLRLGPSPS